MQIRGKWRCAAACLALATGTQAWGAPADWRLDPEGYGPFRVGMSFAQARKLAPALVATPADARASSNCDHLPLPDHPGVALMFVGDELKRIDLFAPGPQTTRGVAPGDPVEQAMQAYPGVAAEPNAYDDKERYLTERSGANAIRFETEKGRIQNIYAGRWAQVQYIEGCL
jgi:hypothetical protein